MNHCPHCITWEIEAFRHPGQVVIDGVAVDAGFWCSGCGAIGIVRDAIVTWRLPTFAPVADSLERRAERLRATEQPISATEAAFIAGLLRGGEWRR